MNSNEGKIDRDALTRLDRGGNTGNRRVDAHLENLALSLIELDTSFRVVRWSAGATALFGWSAEDVLGRVLFDMPLVHNEDQDELGRVLRGMLSSQASTCRVTARVLCRDGAVRHCEWHSSGLYDAQGRPVSILSHVIDVTERRGPEEALRHQAALARKYIDTVQTVIVALDAQGRIAMVNRLGCELLGYAEDELLGQNWFETCLPPPQGIETVYPVFCRMMRGELEAVEYFENEIRCRDGSTRLIAWHNAVLTDAAGNATGTLSSGEDITERKQVEDTLRARERQQAAVAELGQFALSCTDVQALFDAAVGSVAEVLSADYAKLLEIQPDATHLLLRAGVGWRPGLVGRATVDARRNSQASHTLAGKAPVIVDDLRSETRFHGPPLLIEHQVVSGISCAIVGPAGRPWGVLGAHTRQRRTFTKDDVNFLVAIANVVAAVIERHHFTLALRDSQTDLKRAQAVGHIGSWRLNVQDNRLDWSSENHRIFGVPEGTPLSYETFLACVHPEDRDYVDRMWQAALRGEPYDIEHRLIVDGEEKWVRERAELERDGDGRLLGGFGTTQDITDQKRAEEALREADRRKNEFLATLAHELRNPLAPIRNAVEILKRQELPHPASQAARAIIDRQLAHMVRLIDDLLDVSRISRGRLELRTTRVALATVLDNALETARPHIEAAGHRLEVDLPAQPVHLDADPIRLAQVFVNLLNNAAKYTDPGGVIRLSARPDGADVVVTVSDTGIGIEAEHLPHMFDSFSSVRPSAGSMDGGLGIGLSLARSLAQLHGGHIEAASDGPGKGSQFTVRLPASAAVRGSPTAAMTATDVVGRAPARRILVADDSRDIVDSLSMLLELEGNEVMTASDGREVVEIAERERPDVVLLDLGMPKMDGVTACRHIRQQPWGRSIRIIALTGWGQEEARQQTAEAGFDGHLVKPVDRSTLERLVAETTGQSRDSRHD